MADRAEDLLTKIQENALGCTAPCARQIVKWVEDLRAVLKDSFSIYEEKWRKSHKW